MITATEPVETTDDLPIQLTDLVTETGISYRQADYWCRAGYIHTISYRRDGSSELAKRSSSGTVRRLDRAEADVFRLMARLVNAGLTHEAAHTVARAEVSEVHATHTLADGVYLIVIPPQDSRHWSDGTVVDAAELAAAAGYAGDSNPYCEPCDSYECAAAPHPAEVP